MTLTEFLTARLDEDEAVAREAADPADGDTWWPLVGSPRLAPADADHIARHDPARVLAEVEAKRQIVEEAYRYGEPEGWSEGALAIRTLAQIYADHPDYDEAWRL